MADEIVTERTREAFWFGGDATATAKQQVAPLVWVHKTNRMIAAFLASGRVPSLLGGRCLEGRGIAVHYPRKKAMYLDEAPRHWGDIEANGKGRMIIDLLGCQRKVEFDGRRRRWWPRGREREEAHFYATSSRGDERENARAKAARDPKHLRDWIKAANRALD